MTEFWEKGEWERKVKIRKESKDPSDKGGIKGEGINSSWMEDEYGIRVSVERQTEIIAAARRTWVTLSNCGIAVTKFRNAEEIVVSYFRRKLETNFIELHYCHNHWKADRLWQENFSSWGGPPADPKVSAFGCNLTIPPQTHFRTAQNPIWTKAVSL